ncbi:hypothetical protein EP7_001136 [Isosphaeraceae bacterium EP7]
MAGEQFASRSGATLKDLLLALEDRRLDAEALVAAGRFVSSIAMGVYALEICLKVTICQRLDLDYLPKGFEFHHLPGLLTLSGQSRRLGKDLAMNTHWRMAEIYADKLSILRYSPQPGIDRKQAESFHHSMFDRTAGLIPWFKRHLPRNI